jgi:hypothetical protein
MVDIAQVSQYCAGLSQRPAVSPATVVPPVFLHLDPRSDYVSLFRGCTAEGGLPGLHQGQLIEPGRDVFRMTRP